MHWDGTHSSPSARQSQDGACGPSPSSHRIGHPPKWRSSIAARFIPRVRLVATSVCAETLTTLKTPSHCLYRKQVLFHFSFLLKSLQSLPGARAWKLVISGTCTYRPPQPHLTIAIDLHGMRNSFVRQNFAAQTARICLRRRRSACSPRGRAKNRKRRQPTEVSCQKEFPRNMRLSPESSP